MPVLRDFSLTLEPGKILGLVGEFGAGKSMVGRTIAQMLPPGFAIAGGSLEFDGHDLRDDLRPGTRQALLGNDIAFIPQEPLSALNPVLTIGRQIDEHLARLGVGSSRERRARALALFESVHLPHGAGLLRHYPHQISGGMCQRVLIAMAFAGRPRLVIADEPTTALDVTIQARIVQLIAEMQERDGTAVIFITHDLRLAAQICDDIVVLYAGRPAEYGPARSLFSAPAHPYTRCLQLANPSMSGARRALQSLPERMPGLRAWNEISGCAFAPRCPKVIRRMHAGAAAVPADRRRPHRGLHSAGGSPHHRDAGFGADRTRAVDPARSGRQKPVEGVLAKCRPVRQVVLRRGERTPASRLRRTNFSASSAKAAAARPRWRGCWSGWSSPAQERSALPGTTSCTISPMPPRAAA